MILTLVFVSRDTNEDEGFIGFLNSFKTQSIYFYFYNFGGIFCSPLYNLGYNWIGIFFGNWNYVLQKGLDNQGYIRTEKTFLI